MDRIGIEPSLRCMLLVFEHKCEVCARPLDWLDIIFVEKKKLEGNYSSHHIKEKFLCVRCLNEKIKVWEDEAISEVLGLAEETKTPKSEPAQPKRLKKHLNVQ